MINNNEIDPNTGVADVQSNANLKPKLKVSAEDYYTAGQIGSSFNPSIAGGALGIDLDEYTPYTTKQIDVFSQDLDELRSGEQSTLELMGKGFGTFLTTGVGEILKMPGYLAGLGDALAQSVKTGEFDVELATSNVWLDTVKEAQDQIKDEYLQIYAEKASNESLLASIASPEFWASDVADGIGFFASMMLPGAAISKLGTGAKAAKLLGAGTADGSKILKALGGVNKVASGVDVGLITATNTFFESAAEASGFRDNLKKDYEKFRQPDGSYKLPNGKDMTQEDVNKIIGETTASVYNSNLALLILPNLIVNNALFGKVANKQWFKKYATTAKAAQPATTRVGKVKNLFRSKTEQVTGRGALGAVKENLQKGISTLDKVRSASGQIIAGSIMEGFVEEGGQMTVENYFSSQAKKGVTDIDVVDMMDAYTQMLGSVEGQKGMFIGSLLGGGVQGATVNRKERIAKERKLGLIKSMEESIVNIEKASSIWKTVDGKTEVDPAKLVEQIKSNSYLAYNYSVLTQAAERGDTEVAGEAWDNIFVTFAKNYVTEEGGIEFMMEHFDELADSFLGGVNSFLEQAQEKGTNSEEVANDIKVTKERLFKRAEALRQTYEDIQTVGTAKFFGIGEKSPDIQMQFNSRMSDKALRISNTLFSLDEELRETLEEISKSNSSQSPTSDTYRENYLEPRQAALERKIETEKLKYNELFNKKAQEAVFKQLKADIDNERQITEDLEKRQKDFKDRYLPTHKASLGEKGYDPKKRNENGVTPRAGTYFKGKDGTLYRLSRTATGKKNSLSTVYDLIDPISEKRIPYNDEVGMDMGLENPDQVLSRKEAATLEKERRKKGASEPGTVIEPEAVVAQDPDALDRLEFEDEAKKSTPFSTMSAYFDRFSAEEVATNPNGVRWSAFFAANKIDITKTDIMMVNLEDLRNLAGTIFEEELILDEEENNLFAVPTVDGKVLLNDRSELIYSGVPFRSSLENSIVWENYIETNLDLERDFKESPVSEENSFEYKGTTYITHTDFIKAIKTEALDEYEEFRNNIESNDRYSAYRISKGMPQYDGVPKKLTKVLPSIEGVNINLTDTSQPLGRVSVISNGDRYVVGQSKIGEKGNAAAAVGFLADLLVHSNDMISLMEDIPTSDGGSMRLFSTVHGHGAISKYIRFGKSKDGVSAFDLYIDSKFKEGTRELIFIPKEGAPERIAISKLSDRKSKEFTRFTEIVNDKFNAVDVSTLDNNNQDFQLPVAIKNGTIQTKQVGTYQEYLFKNVLQSTIKPISKDEPNFVNQYLEFETHPKRAKKVTLEVAKIEPVVQEVKELSATPPVEIESSTGDKVQDLVEGKNYFLRLNYKDGKVTTLPVSSRKSLLGGIIFDASASTKDESTILRNMVTSGIETTTELYAFIKEYVPSVENSSLFSTAPIVVNVKEDAKEKECDTPGEAKKRKGRDVDSL